MNDPHWLTETELAEARPWSPNDCNRDPVAHGGDGYWYWYDETWSNVCGPYRTADDARLAVAKYAEGL